MELCPKVFLFTRNCFCSPETPHTFGKRNTQFWGWIFRGNTLHTFGRSSKSYQPNWIIFCATWSCDAPLENWHNHIKFPKLRFSIPPKQEFLIPKHFWYQKFNFRGQELEQIVRITHICDFLPRSVFKCYEIEQTTHFRGFSLKNKK